MKRIHSVIGKRKPKSKPDEFIVGNTLDQDLSKTQSRSFHFSPKIFSAISVFIAIFGVYTIFFSKAAPTTVANVWVASNGSDTGSNCKRFASPTANPDSSGATLCKTFSAALNLATAGDSVRVLSGSYVSQSLAKTGLSRDSNFDNNVQFIADGGPGSVTLAGLSIGGSTANSYGAVNLDGFHVTGGPAIQETKDVRLSNFEANNQTYIANSQDIKLEKYVIQPSGFPSVTSAPFSNGWGIGIAQQGSGSGTAPSNITLDGINMHGVRATQAADHPDGIFMWRGGGVPTTTKWTAMVVQNSLFYNNECINWRYNDANPAQVTFENNFFDSSVNGISGCGYYSISVASATGTYRNNTIRGGIQVKEGDCPGTCGATRNWKNNIILGGWSDQGCSNLASDTWNKNILDGSRCSTNDTNTTVAALKLKGGSAYPDSMFTTLGSTAIDAAGSTDYPLVDYLGTARPQGDAPDVGAYEYSDSASCPSFNSYGTYHDNVWPAACSRPFGGNSPFNLAVPTNPKLHANSTNIVNLLTGWGPPQPTPVGEIIGSDYQHPYYIATTSDPIVTISLSKNYYGGGTVLNGKKMRIPKDAQVAGGGDGHITVVQPVNDSSISSDLQGYSIGLYDAQAKPAGGWVTGGTITAVSGGRSHILTGSGIDGDGNNGNTTAAGFNNLAGIIRAQEVEAGQINHALFGIVRCTDGGGILPVPSPNQTAAKCDGSNGYNPVTTNGNSIPLGGRLWLNMTTAEIDALPSSVPAWKKTILKAIAQYGILVGDTGGYGGFDGGAKFSFGLQFESGLTYTSFGQSDKVLDWAKKQGFTSTPPVYLGLGTITDSSGTNIWSKLKVLDPCVSMGTCTGTADSTPPTVSLSSPTAGSTVSGNSVTLSATATDNTGGTGVSKVEFYDGTTLIGSDTSSPYSITWNTTKATNGSHSLTAKAYDNASPQNTATSSAVSVTVSNTTQTTCSTKPGDTNNDQVVNITDIAEILKLYGQTNSTSCADINKDTVINISDIAVVLQNYGK